MVLSLYQGLFFSALIHFFFFFFSRIECLFFSSTLIHTYIQTIYNIVISPMQCPRSLNPPHIVCLSRVILLSYRSSKHSFGHLVCTALQGCGIDRKIANINCLRHLKWILIELLGKFEYPTAGFVYINFSASVFTREWLHPIIPLNFNYRLCNLKHGRWMPSTKPFLLFFFFFF